MAILNFKDLFQSNIDDELKTLKNSLLDLAKAQLLIQEQAVANDKLMKEQNSTREDVLKTNEKVNDSLDDIAKSEIEIGKVTKQTTDIIAKAEAERSKENKTLQKAKIERAEQAKKLKEAIKLENAEVNSIAKLRKENRDLRKERNNVSTSTDEGIAKIKELNAAIDANDEVIKENSDNYVQTKINIGNYSSALDSLPGPLQNVAEGTKGVGQQFKKLLKNPIVLLITAIAGAVIGLFKAFKSTRSGGATLAKAFTNVSAATDVGKKKMREFITTVVDGGDEAKKSWKSLARTVLNLATGNSVAIAQTTAEFEKERIVIRDLKKELIDMNSLFIDIEGDLVIGINEAINAANIQKTIADDSTKSFQERRAAAEEARVSIINAGKLEVKLANERLKLEEKNIEIAIAAGHVAQETGRAITQEGLDINSAYNEAYIAAENAQNQFQLSVLENNKVRAELRQDDFEQELDFLLDVTDAQKTVNERRITDERLTLAQRSSILQETRTLLNDSFNEQIALFERETGVELNRTALREKNNKEIFDYARGLQLSEIATNRLLEVIKERRFAQQDIADLEKDLSQESINRLNEAEETIKSIQLQQTLRLTETLSERERIEIDFEIARRDRLLEDTTLLEEERLAIILQSEENIFDIKNKFRDENEKKEKESIQKFIEGINLVSQTLTSVHDYRNQLIQNEIDSIERQRDNEVAQAEAAGKDTAKIEEKYAKKEAELRTKQAIQNKNNAIFQAVINTAAAITKSLPNLALAALAGVLGTIQVAKISSENIPAFKDGGEMLKSGLAKYSEGGKREIMVMPSGSMKFTPNKETISYVEAGTKFISNWQTEEILKGGITPERINESNKKDLVSSNYIINGDKIHQTVESANRRIELEDTYYRL